MDSTAPAPDSSAPSPQPAPTSCRHDGWTIERQRRFCEALADCGNVELAAEAVGMSREGAYRLRRRGTGRAFALAWDAALLLARQRMVDDVIEMAFEGSVERHFRDGKLVLEKRKRDPRGLLATIERLGTNKALGSAPAKAVAENFERFLDCMEAEARQRRGYTAQFMAQQVDAANLVTRESLEMSQRHLLEALQLAAREDQG